MFVAVVVGICGLPTGFEVTGGLGVVVRGPGVRSVFARAAGVCCGRLPEPCDFASFLSSFCTLPSCVNLGIENRSPTFLLLSSRACGVSDTRVFTFH